MVLTRAQAAKQKAQQSPQPSPPNARHPRKQQRGAAADADDHRADDQDQQQQQQQQQGRPGRKEAAGKMGGRLGKLKTEAGARLSSHPLSSLPASPAGASGPGPDAFSISAVQQQEVEVQAAAAAWDAEQQRQQQRPADSGEAEATSIDKQQQQQPQQRRPADEAASVERGQPAGEPAGAAAEQQPQQQAQPPMPLPRPEKLLKPLPDKPIPCDKLPDGPEPVVVEVEYVAREELQPVEDVDAALQAALTGLSSPDWVEAVRTLGVLRQLVAHHPEEAAPQLEALVPLVLKSVRSLRSSVCKTAIMAVADLYQTYGDALLPLTDVGGQAKPLGSLLAQILLKCSSNDKRFVIEEAQRALQTMVSSLAPAGLLPLLLPYADTHKNPKVRGKAAAAAAEAVGRMGPAELAVFGLPRMLQLAGKLVTDNTPDARDAAKRMIDLLRAAAADPGVSPEQLGIEAPEPAGAAPAPPAGGAQQQEGDDGEAGTEPARQPSQWELLCQAHLSVSAALAVLKTSAE